MQIYQDKYQDLSEAQTLEIPFSPDVFFMFISPTFVDPEGLLKLLNEKHPSSIFIGCSTAGEILGNEVLDATAVITAVKFEKTRLRSLNIDLSEHRSDCFSLGRKIYDNLEEADLRHIFILSDGLNVNGAELVNGMQSRADSMVSITGGLAADGADFKKTFLVHQDTIRSKRIVALGLYGNDLKIGFGSKGGWDSFGIERLVTRSRNNVLYELDGEPALDLYKSFLGEKAEDLPGSGLLFPLSMRDENNKIPVVRTILAIDEEERSLTFAGNIPQGSYVRLMKANIDRIIDGAEQSAKITKTDTDHVHQLAFLISCVGRRLVMKQLVEEEVEAVNEVLGNGVFTTGFYSYGEIAPFDRFSPCTLHNQTMTITTLSE